MKNIKPQTECLVNLPNCHEKKGLQWQKMIEMIRAYKGKRGAVIPVLQEVQAIFNYVPEEAVDYIAEELRLPPSAIYGVLTFYAQFYKKPRGKNIIKVCRGTACHVKKGKMVLQAIKDFLAIEEGETTQDMKFTLETVACLGTCALAPVMIINQNYYGSLDPQKTIVILKEYA